MEKILIALIITVFLVGLGVLIYFLLRHKGNSSDSSTWSNDQINSLKTSIKSTKLPDGRTITDDEANCIVNNFIKKYDYTTFESLKNKGPNSNDVVILELYLMKCINDCIQEARWDNVPKQILDTIFMEDFNNPNTICFVNQIKNQKQYNTFPEFIKLRSMSKDPVTIQNPPQVLKDFITFYNSLKSVCSA